MSGPQEWLTRTVSRIGGTLAPGRAVQLAEAVSGVSSRPAVATSAPQAIVILDRERRVVDAGRGVERVLGRARGDVIGRRFDHVPWLGGRGRIESLWPDGSVHLLEFSATVVPLGEAQLVALRDVTAGHDQQPYPAVRDPRQAAAADLDAAARDVDAVFADAALRVAAALGVDLAGIFEDRGPRRRMILRAGWGWSADSVGAATVSGACGSPVGQALGAGDAVIIADLRRATAPVRPSWLLHVHGVVSGVEIEIPGPERPWGVLAAYTRRPRLFAPDDVDFLRALRDILALAVDRARLADALRAASAEREQAVAETERRTRARITELLHDEALQSLLAVRQHLAVAARRPERQDRVALARDGVQRAIRELRGAVSALHPAAIESGRLRDAIQAVVGDQARAAGFAVTFELDVEPEEDSAPLLLSVIRELTANVAQHAGAREARVALRADGCDLVLEVCDDGCGIAPGRLDAALAEGHIGLASVTRRVRAHGGALAVAPGDHGGTRVRITLPGRVPATG